MDIVRVGLLGVTGIILIVWIKGVKPEFGVLTAAGLGIFLMFYLFQYMAELLVQLEPFQKYIGEDNAFLKILIKAIGCTYVCDFSAGICKDAGYAGAAAQIETFGKLYLMLLAIPVTMELLQTIEGIY